MRYHCQRKSGLPRDRVTLPEWALVALGYTLFIWSSLSLIKISVVTPDMCVAALVYLAFRHHIAHQHGICRLAHVFVSWVWC